MTAPTTFVKPFQRPFARDSFTGTALPEELLESEGSDIQRAVVRHIAFAKAASPRLYLGSPHFHEEPSITPRRTVYLLSPVIRDEPSSAELVYETILALHLSVNVPRDRQIAERLIQLYRDALAEDESISAASLQQFRRFFLDYPEQGMPKITLTPDSTLRARWIQGPGSFVAIEFTGHPLVKLVAEVPRDGETSRHFSSDTPQYVVSTAIALGALFA